MEELLCAGLKEANPGTELRSTIFLRDFHNVSGAVLLNAGASRFALGALAVDPSSQDRFKPEPTACHGNGPKASKAVPVPYDDGDASPMRWKGGTTTAS